MMTIKQLKEMAAEIFEANERSYNVIGLRFDDRKFEKGTELDWSRHLEDDRDFPEYGTEEYNEMIEFTGTSAWGLNENFVGGLDFTDENDTVDTLIGKHAYIIGGKNVTNENEQYGLDDNEVIIQDAEVIARIY